MRDRDGHFKCGACRTELGVECNRFLCAKCLLSLPDDLRRELVTTDGPESEGIRRRILLHLGVTGTITRMMLAIPPAQIKDMQPRGCSCAKPLSSYQKRLGGKEDLICAKCYKQLVMEAQR